MIGRYKKSKKFVRKFENLHLTFFILMLHFFDTLIVLFHLMGEKVKLGCRLGHAAVSDDQLQLGHVQDLVLGRPNLYVVDGGIVGHPRGSIQTHVRVLAMEPVDHVLVLLGLIFNAEDSSLVLKDYRFVRMCYSRVLQ